MNNPYENKNITKLTRIIEEWSKVLKNAQLNVLVIACNILTAWFKDKFEYQLKIPVYSTTDGLNEVFFAIREQFY